MKRIFIYIYLIFICLFKPIFSIGQTCAAGYYCGPTCPVCPGCTPGSAGTLVYPPQPFTAGANLCDGTPWQLVWYDEFNGYTDGSGVYINDLDPHRWVKQSGVGLHPFYSYDPSNITINSGVLYLATNQIPTSPRYTCSWVNGPTTPGLGDLPLFRRGKFEARISYPSYWFSHSNFELTGENFGSIMAYPYYDLSIAEAYGGPLGIDFSDLGSSFREKITAGFGSGCPGPSTTNTETIASNHYCETHAIFDNYHTYTLEWDENYEHWYYDGTLLKTFPRYNAIDPSHTTVCTVPVSGIYNSDPSFPICEGWPHTPSGLIGTDGMYINLSSFIDKDVFRHTSTPYEIGAMKVDWVKVYQRADTIQKGFYNLCDRHMTGPTIICDDAPHTYSVVTSAGTPAASISPIWHWSTSGNLQVISSTTNTITVKRLVPGASDVAWVQFVDDNPDCPMGQYAITLGLGAAFPVHTAIYLAGHWVHHFSLAYAPGTTYHWTFMCPPYNPLYAISEYGNSVGVVMNCNSTLHWACAISNACGNADISNYPLARHKNPTINNIIATNDSEVSETVYFSTGNDFVTLNGGNVLMGESTNSLLYPNPVTNELNIQLGSGYKDNKQIVLKITDLQGRVLIEQTTSSIDNPIVFNTSNIATGMYFVQIIADETKEVIKFTKE